MGRQLTCFHLKKKILSFRFSKIPSLPSLKPRGAASILPDSYVTSNVFSSRKYLRMPSKL